MSPTKESNLPVLIVGGGPVGLALAVELGVRGIKCMLVEQGDGSAICEATAESFSDGDQNVITSAPVRTDTSAYPLSDAN